jgi:hypothetical protein
MRWTAIMTCVVSLAACGGAPDRPLLANAPRPDPAAVAGVAAAAAAAVTLAAPDTAGRRPEKNQDVEKKPITVKENVPSDVLDRLDHATPAAAPAPAKDGPKPPVPEPDGKKRQGPKDALDFSTP